MLFAIYLSVNSKCILSGAVVEHDRWVILQLFGNGKSQRRLTLILPRSCTGTVWFYTSTSNKSAARPKLYTKSLTRDLKRMYSRLTLVRISVNL